MRSLLFASLLALAAGGCPKRQMLTSPAPAPGWSLLPLRYEESRLFFSTTKDDVLVERLFVDPRGEGVLANILRPQPGVLASGDGGQTFALAPRDGEAVRAVLFDPADPARLYARAGGRLLRSADGGRSFAACELPGRVDAAVVAPDGALYAASDAALFLSDDHGLTFRQLPSPIGPDHTPTARYRVRSLAIDPALPGTLYVSLEGRALGKAPFVTRLAGLLGQSSNEAVEALGLVDARDAAPRTFSWIEGKSGVYVTRDRGGVWQRTGLSIDSWLLARDGALYAAPADPIYEAALLARRWPALAAAVGSQLGSTRVDSNAVRPALAYPGRERLVAGPGALVYRSKDGGATFAKVLDPAPSLLLALRESIEQQRAGRIELPLLREGRPPDREGPPPQGQGQGGRGGGGGRGRGRGGGGRSRSAEPRGQEQAAPRMDVIEPLLALIDPVRLLAGYGDGVSLSGIARAGSGPALQSYAYVPTESYWNQLAEAALAAIAAQGEVALGAAQPGPAKSESARFELLHSTDEGASWTAIAMAPELMTDNDAYPAQLAALPSQTLLLVTGRRGAERWRALWRFRGL